MHLEFQNARKVIILIRLKAPKAFARNAKTPYLTANSVATQLDVKNVLILNSDYLKMDNVGVMEK